MMEIKISEKIRELRREFGNTQEALANHLGISVQAISKWERGDGFPDITLLPGIASYYDTTVDVLLGCDEIKKKAKIKEFEERCNLLLFEGKHEEELEFCREMQKVYPKDDTVLKLLMYSLYNINLKDNIAEIIEIANHLLASKNHDCRKSAIQILCFTYKAIGQKEKAAEYAKMASNNEDLMVFVLEGDKLVEHCQYYFWNICGEMQQKLSILLATKEARYTTEESYHMRKMLYDFYHMVFSKNDFGFWHGRLGTLCFDMALNSAESGECERAIDELEEMVEHFIK